MLEALILALAITSEVWGLGSSVLSRVSRSRHSREVIPDSPRWRYAEAGEFPWIVSIQHTNPVSLKHFCGGSLATTNRVLTACHCVHRHSEVDDKLELTDPDNVVVIAGTINLKSKNASHKPVEMEVDDFLPHGKCKHFHDEGSDDFGGWDFDFAWVILKDEVVFDGFTMAPFTLPTSDSFKMKADLMRKMANEERCHVAGWGRRKINRSKTEMEEPNEDPRSFWPELTVIEVTLNDFGSCYNIMCRFARVYCEIDHWRRSQICATGYGTMEVCFGDSGGPLMCGPKHNLYGLVGWGPSCGKYRVPSMYPTIYSGWDFVVPILNDSILDKESTAAGRSYQCKLVSSVGQFLVAIILMNFVAVGASPKY